MSIIDFTDTQDLHYEELRNSMPNYYFSYGKTIIYTSGDVTELDNTHSGSVACYHDSALKNQYKTYQIYQIYKNTKNTYLIGNEVELPLVIEEQNNNIDNHIFGYSYTQQIPNPMYCRIIDEYTDYSLFTTFPITVPQNSEINEVEFVIPQNEDQPPTTNYLSPIFYELTENHQLYIDESVESNITFVCFDRFNKYHLHELKVKATNNYIDMFKLTQYSISIETVKSDILSSCFMLYSIIRHTSYPSNKDYDIFNMIGETGEMSVLLCDSVMIPIDKDLSYNNKNNNKNDINEYTLVVDLSTVLSHIIKSDTGYGSSLNKRYTSLTEITNIMSIGSYAKLWYFPLNNETNIVPIQSQLLHIREITELGNNLLKIRFYERVINYVRNNNYNYYQDNIKLTGLNIDNYIISLQVYNSGPYSFIECSGVGECNRDNGLCKCKSGYEGIACERTSCPNNCNGRGICEVIESDDNGYGYIHTQTRCKCDGGYRGSDCSMSINIFIFIVIIFLIRRMSFK